MSEVKFSKQTMKMKINWKAAKDFDLHYEYDYHNKQISDDENGCNYPNGTLCSLANLNKFEHIGGSKKEDLYKYAAEYGGTPKPAFTVTKGTQISVKFIDTYWMQYELLDGPYKGTKFKADLPIFRTCLIGESDDDIVVSKYRIFVDGKLFKPKYFTNIGRVKLALLTAFGFSTKDTPYYIGSVSMLQFSDCKNIQIMRYDNDSKIGVPIPFDVEALYIEKMKSK